MQAPHSAHESSTTAFSSWMTIESKGQDDTHSPQPVHFSKSTFTAIIALLEWLGKSTETALERATDEGYSSNVFRFHKRGLCLERCPTHVAIPVKYRTICGILFPFCPLICPIPSKSKSTLVQSMPPKAKCCYTLSAAPGLMSPPSVITKD